jgi:hypothetical protein
MEFRRVSKSIADDRYTFKPGPNEGAIQNQKSIMAGEVRRNIWNQTQRFRPCEDTYPMCW